MDAMAINGEKMLKLRRKVQALGYCPCNMIVSWPTGAIEEGAIMGEKYCERDGIRKFALWSFGNDAELFWGHYEMTSSEAFALFVEKAATFSRGAR